MSQYSQLGCTEELQLPNVVARLSRGPYLDMVVGPVSAVREWLVGGWAAVQPKAQLSHGNKNASIAT